MREPFRLTNPEPPPPPLSPEERAAARMSERQREEAFAALTGLTKASCPDVRERAARVAAELNARIERAGIDPRYLRGRAEVTVRQIRNTLTRRGFQRRRVGAVHVDAVFDGANSLFVRVGGFGKGPQRLNERLRGFDFDRIVDVVAARAAQQAEEVTAAAREADARNRANALAATADPLLVELADIEGAVSRGTAMFKVTVDVQEPAEVFEVARLAQRLRVARSAKRERSRRGDDEKAV